ncbi:tetratricopeptide repeat protein [Oscillospiraceae bacterium LCP25S3_E3]
MEKAAENGDVKACIDLAELYLSGEGLSKDLEKAEKYLLLAEEKGEIDAYCKLALIYVNEKQWYDKGFSLLEKAHEKGSIEGTRLLGLCYKAGIGCKKSRSKAKALLKKAADKGDEEAKAELKKFRF